MQREETVVTLCKLRRIGDGNEAMVGFLLEKGADVNTEGGWYGNTACAGRERLVKIRLENNVNVNAQGGWFRYALDAALAHDHEAVVQLLLEKEATRHTNIEELGLASW
jgi:ankyrin repeat protein